MAAIMRRRRWPEIPFEDIKKRARIVVIDDSEFIYLPLFKKDGYNIEKWSDIIDLPKLEIGYFDIILLDILGVGKEQSADQGLGILRHLRQVSPAQIIIAYSSSDWSLKYQAFFLMADSVLAKSDDYVNFKRVVDHLLNDRFSLGFYLERITKIASPYVIDKDKLQILSERAILKRNPGKLESFLKECIDKKDVINMILHIVQVAVGIMSL